MFGNISNWINTNLPQVPPVSMPSMPNINMPNINMPNINMPSMPQMPDIFHLNKNTSGDAQSTEAITNASDSKSSHEASESAMNKEQQAQTGASNLDEIKAEPLADQTSSEDTTEANGQSFLDIDAQKALGSAKEFGSNFGNMLFSMGKNASSNVMKTATHLKDVIEKKSLIGDFTKENEKFVNEKKIQQRREDSALPPWVGYNEEDILKEQILELSQDTRNFLRSPPPGVEFQFDFNLSYPVAMVTLEEDQNLKDMRFKLVPKHINEESFWRNYFYRVSLIKQSTQLEQLNNENKNSKDDLQADENSIKLSKTESVSSSVGEASNHQLNTADSNAGANNEFVSDSYEQEELNDADLQSELKQLNLDSNKKTDDLEDWDKDLPEDLDSISAEELEKEINQMIGK